jgi:hypothetical protein
MAQRRYQKKAPPPQTGEHAEAALAKNLERELHRQSHSHASESHLHPGSGAGPDGSQTTQLGATHIT